MKFILGKKLKMSQIFEEKEGDIIPITLIEVSPSNISIFKQGDIVKVAGISKGKGFQGAVKRWGFRGRGASHGVKHEARTVGSVGTRFPQRVIKGKKMPGRMGGNRITVRNLKIVKINKENNLIAVKGAVPGPRGTLLKVQGL